MRAEDGMLRDEGGGMRDEGTAKSAEKNKT
jgi:hypothetical protein